MAANEQSMQSLVVADAENHIVGRLSSKVAKLLLDGKRVVVVNAEKSLLSGNRRSVLNEWLSRLEIRSVVNPKHGPFHPRRPDRIFARVVRGMLPRRKSSGIAAFKRLRVYCGVPEIYRSFKMVSFEDAKAKRPLPYYIPLSNLAAEMGWRRLQR